MCAMAIEMTIIDPRKIVTLHSVYLAKNCCGRFVSRRYIYISHQFVYKSIICPLFVWLSSRRHTICCIINGVYLQNKTNMVHTV